MRYAAATHKGLIRETNEDYYTIINPGNNCGQIIVFVIADGMGGHNSGEVASRKAVEHVEERLMQDAGEFRDADKLPALIEEIMEQANSKVYEMACSDIEHLGMGTTMTLSVFTKDRVITGHVGDSRLYAVGPKGLEKITRDHTLIEELVQNGSISRDEAQSHPNRNIITKALGCGSRLAADIYETPFEKGDKFLFCTDGLTNLVSEEDIHSIIVNEDDPEKACSSLIDKAILNGGTDNITVIVVYS